MIKYKKILLIPAIVIFLAVLPSGCWDSKDINDKLIVTTIAFDVKDGEIWYYIEIANTEAGKGGETSKSSGGGEKYVIVKGHNKTLPEVRESLNRQLDKPLYLSGVRALVLTEKFATEYLVEYLYRFRADETYRKKGLTVITNEDPELLFKSAQEKNTSVGFAIDGMIKTLDDLGKSFTRTTSRLLENLSDKYTGILVPCIGLQEKEISLVGYSVVSGPTVTGFLSVEEARGVVFLKADNPEFSYIVPFKDVRYTIDVKLAKRKIKPSYENGKISYDIKFNFEAELKYGDKKTPYNFNEEANEEVTQLLTTMLKAQLTEAVDRAQKEFRCDYLQFDDEFRIHFPKEFESMDWQKEFVKASINIDVAVDLSSSWMMDYKQNEAK